jgi:hypothetical protein
MKEKFRSLTDAELDLVTGGDIKSVGTCSKDGDDSSSGTREKVGLIGMMIGFGPALGGFIASMRPW